MKKTYMVYSTEEDESREGFFDGYSIEAKSEEEAVEKAKAMLSAVEFETLEID